MAQPFDYEPTLTCKVCGEEVDAYELCDSCAAALKADGYDPCFSSKYSDNARGYRE